MCQILDVILCEYFSFWRVKFEVKAIWRLAKIWINEPSFREDFSDVSGPFILSLNYLSQDKIIMDVSLAFSGERWETKQQHEKICAVIVWMKVKNIWRRIFQNKSLY